MVHNCRAGLQVARNRDEPGRSGKSKWKCAGDRLLPVAARGFRLLTGAGSWRQPGIRREIRNAWWRQKTPRRFEAQRLPERTGTAAWLKRVGSSVYSSQYRNTDAVLVFSLLFLDGPGSRIWDSDAAQERAADSMRRQPINWRRCTVPKANDAGGQYLAGGY